MERGHESGMGDSLWEVPHGDKRPGHDPRPGTRDESLSPVPHP